MNREIASVVQINISIPCNIATIMTRFSTEKVNDNIIIMRENGQVSNTNNIRGWDLVIPLKDRSQYYMILKGIMETIPVELVNTLWPNKLEDQPELNGGFIIV